MPLSCTIKPTYEPNFMFLLSREVLYNFDDLLVINQNSNFEEFPFKKA